MNDPFETHNVKNLSPSSINLFIKNPAKYILKVSGYKDNIGVPAMWRGTAVDFAICSFLNDECSENDCLAVAQNKFIDLHNVSLESNQYIDQDKVTKEYEKLNQFIDVSTPHFQQFGIPFSTQEKIELVLEDLPIPIIGYTDLQYENTVRDIKTIGKLDKNVKDETLRQMAVYEKATGKVAFLDYVYATKSKAEVRTVLAENTEYHFGVVLQACKSIMRLLGTSSDISEVAQHIMPDFDRWDFSEGEKEAAKKLWRL